MTGQNITIHNNTKQIICCFMLAHKSGQNRIQQNKTVQGRIIQDRIVHNTTQKVSILYVA